MKKFVKVCVIIGIGLVIVGAGGAISALAMGAIWEFPFHNWNVAGMPDIVTEVKDRIENEVYDGYRRRDEWQEYSFSDINKLKIDISSNNVNVIEGGDDDQIRVTFSDSADWVELNNEGDELIIQTSSARHWSDHLGREHKIDIEVPSGYYFQEAEINIGSGSFNADRLYAGELELKVKTGSIEVMNGSSGKLDLKCNSGKIKYYGISEGEVDAGCSSGSISLGLTGSPEDYDYELKCRSGSIEIQGEVFADIAVEKKIINNGSKMMELESRSGKIKVNFE